MSRATGIDVSNNNGAVNWNPWKGHIQFAEMKATEGLDFEDQQFARNWKAAHELELYRFPYHFGHPGISPAKQAAYFTEFVRDYGLGENDQYVLDLETTDGESPLSVSMWGRTFCLEMNKINPGHRIIVQTFPGFIQDGNCAALGAWHLWLMDWNVPEPVMPLGPWRNWDLWQYATGHIDRDVFNGDEASLARFCSTTGPPRN